MNALDRIDLVMPWVSESCRRELVKVRAAVVEQSRVLAEITEAHYGDTGTTDSPLHARCVAAQVAVRGEA